MKGIFAAHTSARALLALALPLPTIALANERAAQPQPELPAWSASLLREPAFASIYAVSRRLDPFFLQGDFNGGGRNDVAVLVERRATRQTGVAILHAGARRAIVVGAGRPLGNGGADFNWLDAWSVRPRASAAAAAAKPRHPWQRGDALLVQKLEAASALVYWNGSAYRWRQLGD